MLHEVATLVKQGMLRLGPVGEPGERGPRNSELAIGYRQALDLLSEATKANKRGGYQSDDEDALMTDFIKAFQGASRQFAKRQLNWFRSDPTVIAPPTQG